MLASLTSHAQNFRIAKGAQDLFSVPIEVMPFQENESLLEAELARREPGLAPKFAYKFATNINPGTHGLWEEIPGGKAVWRLAIYSAGAKSLNLGFTTYEMPEGGQMILYSPDRRHKMGPFSRADNEDHGQLWTPILEGDELIIEVQVPQAAKKLLKLELASVNHDFLGFAQIASGDCNLDVACGENDGWSIVNEYRNVIRSVANIGLLGDSYCTGFLINNTRNDQTPYFMTADHCGFSLNNAATLVAYWGYENNSCRQPDSDESGGSGNGSLETYSSGAYFRAAYPPADMTLLELDDPVPISAAPFMAGWNITNEPTTDTIACVHHPNNDEKRISFEFDPTYFGSWDRDEDYVPNGNHLIVPDWDIGTTEGGSSGAPLFNKNQEVIGQLHGGYAACGNDDFDSFGRLFSAWEGGGTAQTRLKDWLDPDNLGVLAWAGRDMYSEIFAAEVSREICLPGGLTYTLQIGTGFSEMVELTIPDLPIGVTATFSVNPVSPGESTVLSFENLDIYPEGWHTLTIEGSDGNNTKNIEISLGLFTDTPEAVSLAEPLNNAMDAPSRIPFSWQPSDDGITYELEVADTPSFDNIIMSSGVISEANFMSEPLESLTEYFWRVRATNTCGVGEWSPVHSFITSIVVCDMGDMIANNPVTISSMGTPSISSTLNVAESMTIADVKVENLNIKHTWVGDLEVELEGPDGTVVRLFDRPGNGDCDSDDILVKFDDTAIDSYTAFDQTCNEDGVGISGSFQPLESLSAFAGKNAQGTWTLRLIDHVDQDGGTLESWSLSFCATLPALAEVYPEFDLKEACPSQTAELRVQTGTGYTGPVTLAVTNLPNDVTVNIDPNPVSPGGFSTIQVDGLSDLGDFNATITGTDGSESSSKIVTFQVIDQPSSFSTSFPEAGAVDIENQVTFNWGSSTYAKSYRLVVHLDSLAGAAAVNEVMSGNEFSAILSASRTYVWEVFALNECGEFRADGGQFRTAGPLIFNALPNELSICKSREDITTLNLGSGFLSPLQLSYTVSPAGDFDVIYDVDPDNVMADGSVEVRILPLATTTPGFYDFQFIADDGFHNEAIEVNVAVRDVPAATNLTEPAAGAMVDAQPTFLWEAIPEVSFYAIQVARDTGFTDLVESTSVSINTFDLDESLAGGETYYWRVYAYNSCGNEVSITQSFSTLVTGVNDLPASTFSLQPNPAQDVLTIFWDNDWAETTRLQWFGANGMLLKEMEIEASPNTVFPVAQYPNGIYWLRVIRGTATRSERIIVQH